MITIEREKLERAIKAMLNSNSTSYEILNAADALNESLTQPAQEPVAWCVIGNGKFGKYELGQTFVDYAATHNYWKNRGYELVPVYTNPQPQEPRNFCPRCGKRTADLTVIHTCTPPRGLEMT